MLEFKASYQFNNVSIILIGKQWKDARNIISNN